MDNNFYANIYFEFQTHCKGLYGKFKGNHTYHHKYGFNQETINEIVTDVRKYIKEDNAEINFYIDSLDWYGEPMIEARLLHEYDGKIILVTWEEGNTYGNKTEISSRDIRKVVENYLAELDAYVRKEMN